MGIVDARPPSLFAHRRKTIRSIAYGVQVQKSHLSAAHWAVLVNAVRIARTIHVAGSLGS